MAAVMGLPLQPDDEVLEDVPEHEKAADPLRNASVVRNFLTPGGGSQQFSGKVVEIEFGPASGDRLYRIMYNDGDLQHFTADEVRAHMVQAAPQAAEVQQVPAPAEAVLEAEVAEDAAIAVVEEATMAEEEAVVAEEALVEQAEEEVEQEVAVGEEEVDIADGFEEAAAAEAAEEMALSVEAAEAEGEVAAVTEEDEAAAAAAAEAEALIVLEDEEEEGDVGAPDQPEDSVNDNEVVMEEAAENWEQTGQEVECEVGEAGEESLVPGSRGLSLPVQKDIQKAVPKGKERAKMKARAKPQPVVEPEYEEAT